MACVGAEIKGLQNMCDSSVGGVKNIWIGVYPTDLKLTEDAGIVTDIKDGTSAVTWHKYYVKKNVANFTSTQTIDPANGVSFVTTDLSLVFTKMDTPKRIEMTALALNDLIVIVEDANNTKWLLGKDNPVTVSAGTGETGTAATDGNKYTLTLQDIANTFPFEVSKDVTLPVA